MKIIFILLSIVTIIRCSNYSFSIGNECDHSKCPPTQWIFNNTEYSFNCPQTGQYKSQFKLTSFGYVFEFFADKSDKLMSIPLRYNQNVKKNGLQYLGNMNNSTQIAILNCTYPISKKYTSLCYDHDLVGGKMINNQFVVECSFGLDIPHNSFMEEQKTPIT